MKMSNRRLLVLSMAGLLTCGLCYGLGVGSVNIGVEASSGYSITFDKNSNRLSSGVYDGTTVYSGSGVATTALGNAITFDYSGFYNPTDSWQKIKTGGYFANAKALRGIKSLTLVRADRSAAFEVYWSDTKIFSESKKMNYVASSSLSVTCDLGYSYPNFIKVVADSDAAFASMSINFDCTEHSPHLLGTSFSFGRYPQTLVEDSDDLAGLAYASDEDGDGYLEYNNAEYVKATAAGYNGNTYQSDSGKTFTNGTAYYFKVEPIVWKVLSGADGTSGLLLSEKVLDHSAFATLSDGTHRSISGATVMTKNYQYSTLRALLNGYDGTSYSIGDFSGKGFLDLAFNAHERDVIPTTDVDNSPASELGTHDDFSCANTNDKIFALSYQEFANASYGFNADITVKDAARKCVLTDYSRATGAYNNYLGNGMYWTRSGNYQDNYSARAIRETGDGTYPGCDYAYVGVRPALNINLE
jgi:hypothetical protein